MTLLQTIQAIEDAARMQPSVAMIVPNDVFRLNVTPDARYGVFAWTQRQHAGDVDGDFHRFAFSLFYVDRLTADKANEVEIQSVGIQTLEAILRELRDQGIFPVDGYTFDTFNQRFEDECAGVWCSVTFDVPVSPLCVNPEPVPPGPEPPAEWTGLTFTCEEAGVLSFYRDNNTLPPANLEVSTDGGTTWEEKVPTAEGTALAVLQPGGKVFVRGYNNYMLGHFNATGKFAASGNIMSIIDAENYETLYEFNYTSAFMSLFYAGAPSDWLTAAPELPATKLNQDCYRGMFTGCTGLKVAPALPATTLYYACYMGMFQGCTGLTAAPELPAKELKMYCYRAMFYGCSSLKEITCLATDFGGEYDGPTLAWLQGVATSGTFRKAAGVEWPTGGSGIPAGWTVEEV